MNLCKILVVLFSGCVSFHASAFNLDEFQSSVSYRTPKPSEVNRFLFDLNQRPHTSYPFLNCMMRAATEWDLYPQSDWLSWIAQFERFTLKEVEMGRKKISPFFEIQQTLRSELSQEGVSLPLWKHLEKNTKVRWARWNRSPQVVYKLNWYDQETQLEFFKESSDLFNRIRLVVLKQRGRSVRSSRKNAPSLVCEI